MNRDLVEWEREVVDHFYLIHIELCARLRGDLDVDWEREAQLYDAVQAWHALK